MKHIGFLHKHTISRSNVTFDGIHYELVEDDWRARAERLQSRRWHMLREATKVHSAHNAR